MPLNYAQLVELIDEKVISGGRRTLASNLRDVLYEISDAATSGGGGGGTIDSVPTDGSSNAVSSNGVYDALLTKLALSGGSMSGDIAMNTSYKIKAASAPDNYVYIGVVGIDIATGAAADIALTSGGNATITANSGSISFFGGLGVNIITSAGQDIILSTDGSGIIQSDSNINFSDTKGNTWASGSYFNDTSGYLKLFAFDAFEIESSNAINFNAAAEINLSPGGGNSVQVSSANVRFDSGYGIDVAATVGSDVLNIGVTNANVINIGSATATVNILGAVVNEYATNAYITDKLITLNKDGGTATGIEVGFEIEENAVITGYLKTNAARTGYSFLAPANAADSTFVFSSTSSRTITFADASGTVALTNNKLSAFASTTSAELAGVISDETGSGVLVFSIAPTFTGATVFSTAASNVLPINIVRGTGSASILEFSKTGFTDNGALFQYSDGTGAITGLTVNATVSDAGTGTRVNSSHPGWFFQLDSRTATDRFNIVRISTSDVLTIPLQLSNAGLLTLTGGLTGFGDTTMNADVDSTHVFGRIALGSPGSDNAYFAHYDNLSTTNYGVRQQASGVLALNSPTGGNITMRINNVAWATLTSSLFTVETANTQVTALQLLDTTYKTAFDVSATNALRIASGFTSLVLGVGTISSSASLTISVTTLTLTSNGGVSVNQAYGGSGTGDIFHAQINGSFTKASINATYAGLRITSTINQTGTSVGNITFFEVNPTLTSVVSGNSVYAAKFSIASATDRWNIYADGTASNYIAGNTGIGTTTTTAAFLTMGAATTAKAAINFIAGVAPFSPNNGDFWFDGTDVKIRVAGATKTFTLT